MTTANTSIAALWARAKPLLEAKGDSLTERERAELFGDEARVLAGRIETGADAAAKLDAALRSFDIGDRADKGDVSAIRAVIDWLLTGRCVEAPASPGRLELSVIADSDFILWDREREGWTRAAEQPGLDEDDIARRVDRADEFEDLIRAAPCRSKLAARMKLEALCRLGVNDRANAPVAAGGVFDQLFNWLETL